MRWHRKNIVGKCIFIIKSGKTENWFRTKMLIHLWIFQKHTEPHIMLVASGVSTAQHQTRKCLIFTTGKFLSRKFVGKLFVAYKKQKQKRIFSLHIASKNFQLRGSLRQELKSFQLVHLSKPFYTFTPSALEFRLQSWETFEKSFNLMNQPGGGRRTF